MKKRIQTLVDAWEKYVRGKRKSIQKAKKPVKRVRKKSTKEIEDLKKDIKGLKNYIKKLEKSRKPVRKPVRKPARKPEKKVPEKPPEVEPAVSKTEEIEIEEFTFSKTTHIKIKFDKLDEVPGYNDFFKSKGVFACFFRVKAIVKIAKDMVIEQWMNSEAVEIVDFFQFNKEIYRELADKYMIVSILEKYLIGIVYAETP